jgi:aldehyde dehydrogenase (NAD+)
MSIKEIFNTMEYGNAFESAQQADAWLESRDRTLLHYINGKWCQPETGQFFDTSNPANGKKLAQVADGSEQDVAEAVASAHAAKAGWKKLGGHGRAKYLYALARQVQKHARLFAVLESLDNGKPIRESRDIDIPLVARHFYHHAGWAQVMDRELPDYEPLGVVGQIIPWNFPLLMLAWKIAPALAMGNTLVLKPAEFTSTTAILFAQICDDIGLPKGVVNIVLGDAKAGSALVAHPLVNKIAFTGSTEVGRILRRETAGTGKKLSLELGGKSAFVVYDDADLDSTVEGLVDAIWFNQGQVCCAGSRLLVQESVKERFLAKVKARMAKLVSGDSLDKNIDMGALVDESQRSRIASLVALGAQEGGVVWQPDTPMPTTGCYYPPTIITDVEPASTLAQEEIFGPVLGVSSFRTPAESVALANNSRYGLAVSLWTENINLALDIAPKIKAGVVWVNCTNVFDAAAGFGGYRESGFGREGGKEGLFEYVKPRWEAQLSTSPVLKAGKAKAAKGDAAQVVIDRTPKLYIGGKQVRPDSGYTDVVRGANGQTIAELPQGSRKDIRNAVEAAQAASGWTQTSAHNRAQVLYYVAENFSARAAEFEARIVQLTGKSARAAKAEVEQCIDRLYTYAALTDKYDGDVHSTPMRAVTLAMKEALGVIGIVAPEEGGLLGLLSVVLPAIAMGNRVVVVPSEATGLLACDLYQVLDTSDLPGGVINIVTGDRVALTDTLARHYDIEGLWYWGTAEGSTLIETEAAATMKRTWVNYGRFYDWHDDRVATSEQFLRKATEIKNIWIPYGE